MCWKEEWAAAIGNLNNAIIHTQRAKEKLQRRLERNLKNLQQLQSSKKHNYETELRPVRERISGNRLGINACNTLIHGYLHAQDTLKALIDSLGINKAPKSKRTTRLMSGSKKTQQLVKNVREKLEQISRTS